MVSRPFAACGRLDVASTDSIPGPEAVLPPAETPSLAFDPWPFPTLAADRGGPHTNDNSRLYSNQATRLN